MTWLEDAISGILKGLDSLGRIRLYKNDGEPLPDAQAAAICTTHHADTDNPHEVSDTQVHDGVDGTVEFDDGNMLPHIVTIVNGRITNWVIDGDEQLS